MIGVYLYKIYFPLNVVTALQPNIYSNMLLNLREREGPTGTSYTCIDIIWTCVSPAGHS